MTTNTAGIQIKSHRRSLVDLVELLSSMRFAISLLVLIAFASVIGTVLKQNEPMTNYVNQFGPFWFDVFDKLGLYAVYSVWWFWLILAFLVLSTSLCIMRNAPKMLNDMRSWRENVREQSLRNFHHHAEWALPLAGPVVVQQLINRIAASGYKVKPVSKEGATLIAAKQGAANKWGYIFAHSAIVIICIGGLLDSNLPIRLQLWFLDKEPFSGNGVIAQIPQKHRLGLSNPTFRGDTLIPEGSSSSTAIIPQRDGVLVQDLPFTIELKKFIVDYYSTGMPKLFASEVVVHDAKNNKTFPATIKVNEPLIYQGVAVYQSSFEDGGSKLKLTGYPMTGTQHYSFEMTGEVGNSTPLNKSSGTEYTVEWSGFRAFNVENMARSGQDLRAVNTNKTFRENFSDGLDKQLGAAAKNSSGKDLKNVGPSVQYKLRDKTGQAREYHSYMQPVRLDGDDVLLTGMRESPGEPFRYVRIPVDDNDGVEEWMRLRGAMQDLALRQQAAQRFAQRAVPDTTGGKDKMRYQLQESAAKGLTIFAGSQHEGGYIAVSKFLERVPAAEQEKAADIFMKILNGAMWDLWQLARERDGLKEVTFDAKHSRFLQLATNALSDAFFYNAPIYLRLNGFEEVKASVFQVSRSPGKNIVYLGCLLLTLGVFSMFYIRERRLWVWLRPDGDNQTHVLMAMSSQRKTLGFEKEFEEMKIRLSEVTQ